MMGRLTDAMISLKRVAQLPTRIGMIVLIATMITALLVASGIGASHALQNSQWRPSVKTVADTQWNPGLKTVADTQWKPGLKMASSTSLA